MGNAAVVRLPQRFALAQRVICFRPYNAVNSDFLTLQILAEPFQSILDKTATGLTAKGIKAAKLKRLPVAVAPLVEQCRIVARVNELMALCDRLELERTEREGRRGRLTTASHHYLNDGSDADALRKHAHLFLGHLPRMTAVPDQIKQLRQTVLNLAVRGKLVSQISGEEPVSTLLQLVHEEQKDLIRRRMIKAKCRHTLTRHRAILIHPKAPNLKLPSDLHGLTLD